MQRRMLIDAIVGKGFSSCAEGNHFQETGFARFCGNQHNPDWAWDIDVLDKLSVEALSELYNRNEFSTSSDATKYAPIHLSLTKRAFPTALEMVYGNQSDDSLSTTNHE
jgi:hypothetical protein